jgi:hypothetical protein
MVVADSEASNLSLMSPKQGCISVFSKSFNEASIFASMFFLACGSFLPQSEKCFGWLFHTALAFAATAWQSLA